MYILFVEEQKSTVSSELERVFFHNGRGGLGRAAVRDWEVALPSGARDWEVAPPPGPGTGKSLNLRRSRFFDGRGRTFGGLLLLLRPVHLPPLLPRSLQGLRSFFREVVLFFVSHDFIFSHEKIL